ncbi:MAG: O-antigen ligase family protein [Candidatus Moranbacteria bacterium]|nr:O-antigen ligase family protein [Candidatus Moranbacteria bacterium]
MSMLEKALLIFLFLLPFQFALNPTIGTDLPVGRVLAAVIILWWLIRGLAKKNIHLPPIYFTASVISFLGIAAASFLWVENMDFALRKFFFLLNFFPLLFVFFDLGRERNKSSFWVKAFCAGAFGTALVGLGIFMSQFLFGVEKVFAWLIKILPFFLGSNLGQAVIDHPSLLVNIGGATLLRATAFFPDPHVAAFYFGISGFLALGLFFQERKKYFLVMSAVLFFADLLTFSRGAYFGLLVGTITFLLFGWKIFHTEAKKWIVVGLILSSTLFFSFGQPVLSRFLSSFALEDTSSIERVVLWQEAFENIIERPFFGTGLGNYILAVRPAESYRTPYYAHNLYLDVATELGLVGLFFFLLILFIPLYGVLQNYVRTKNILSLSLAASLILYLIHSVFETALYSIHIFPLLLFVLALALIANEDEKSDLK